MVVVLVQGMIGSLEHTPENRYRKSRSPIWQPLLYVQAVAFAAYTMLVGYLIAESSSQDYATLGLYFFGDDSAFPWNEPQSQTRTC